MGRYEDLIIKYNHLHICDDFVLPGSFSGIYNDGVILIDKNTSSEKKLEILAEELAHHEITHGDIINQKDIQNKKYELKARRLAYEKLISLKDLIDAYLQGINNLYELANFFEVTESFVLQSIEHYKQKYGYSTRYGKYVIQFEPLRVFEYKNIN
ncbi:ImmA/IrrE family metallo-endopeptidase [Staphylococcus hominis]|uniref:ImmA/IrrE family metallo-endopeptidase n=1 Tax=Staphylococcus hominis TaxID=1290 RepID=UPI001F5AD561|nr:ImmA/IrrE family metallo-endopeptidase [Staphylococcus hominis]